MAHPDPVQLSAAQLGAAYRAGRLDPVDVAEAYLERVAVGAVYRLVTAERARRQAQASARR
ncbi:MAG: amidase, partial [Trueperaceae bacterium]